MIRPTPSGCTMCLWGFMTDYEDDEDEPQPKNSRREDLKDLFGVAPVEKIVVVSEDGTERVAKTSDDSYLFPNMVY